MEVVGQEFDPTLHEAVLREENQEHAEDIVCEELQRGYHRDGRVLRHAMVKVSMGPGPESSSDTASEQPQEGDA
jgi:molecular chaperone GrpE